MAKLAKLVLLTKWYEVKYFTEEWQSKISAEVVKTDFFK